MTFWSGSFDFALTVSAQDDKIKDSVSCDFVAVACAITLLLKVLPFLIFVGIVASQAFCGGCFFQIWRNL